MDQENCNSVGFFDLAASIRAVRAVVKATGTPETVQDGYEEIIDNLLVKMGLRRKHRDLFWRLTDSN